MQFQQKKKKKHKNKVTLFLHRRRFAAAVMAPSLEGGLKQVPPTRPALWLANAREWEKQLPKHVLTQTNGPDPRTRVIIAAAA